MRRIVVLAVAAGLGVAGCSSSTSKSATTPSTSSPTSATTATPTLTPAASSSADHAVEALECGMFDAGAFYLNQEWPAIVGGHPRFGYGLNLSRAADTWQKGLNSYSSDPSLDAAIGRAESGVTDMMSALAKSDGSAPVEIGDQVRQVQDAFTAVSGLCTDVNYHITQPLAQG